MESILIEEKESDQDEMAKKQATKAAKKGISLSQPVAKTTRKKTIDFSKLGQKMTLSNTSCHKCKTMIPVNEENICNGPLPDSTVTSKKLPNSKKKLEICSRRFCNDCL